MILCARSGLSPRWGQGFSLIELLVAMAVIGVIAGLLMPVLGSIRASADAVYCKNNLRQAYLANIGYSQDHKGLIAPSAMAFTNRPTVELPWSYFVASYADRTGYGASTNREIVPEIAICKPFLKRYPGLMDWSDTSVGNVRAWGYVRNPLLVASHGNSTGTTFGRQDSSTSCDSTTGAQLTANFTQFRWSQVTNTSSRLFLGEGYYESSQQSHAVIIQTGISASAATVKYQYTYQWGSTLMTANGPITIGTGTPQTPGGATSDFHRGKRAYVMCDGSVRNLTDRYDQTTNQVVVSIINPQILP